MQRKTLDKLVSWGGLTLAAVLIVAGSLLTWANSFVGDQVHSQLAAQKIYFPPKGSDAIAGSQFAPMRQYAGQQLTTGAQAKTYADHFIAIHLKEIGGGQTYAELSSKAQANPDNAKLAAQVDTMFRGTTLRGMLLDAYAFSTMGTIAGIAAIVSFVGAGIFLVLSGLGFVHARRVPESKTVFAGAPGAPGIASPQEG